MKRIGCYPHVPAPDVTPPVHSDWLCQKCGKTFGTGKALSVHLYKQHQQHADVRSFMDSTTCGACLKNYHTVQRLRQHLQYPKGCCLRKLRTIWWPMDPQALVNYKPVIDTKAAHRIPAIQAFGPLLPDRQTWQAAKPEKSFPPTDAVESHDDSHRVPQEQPGRSEDIHASPHVDEAPQVQVPPPVDEELLGQLVLFAMQWKCGDKPAQWDELMSPLAFQTLVRFSQHLQDVLVYDLEFDRYIEVYSWTETLLAKHFVYQRKDLPTGTNGPHDSSQKYG